MEGPMPNKIDLAGRNAVVTGGAQGIGRAITERLLDSGAAVAIWDRDKEFAEKTAKELSNRGKVIVVACDVTNLKDVERARDDTVKAFGGIDILVNNAGIAGKNATTWDYPADEWAQVMRVNLDGPFYCCRAIAPGMIAQNYGRIVNIASVDGKEGNTNASAYSVSKAGVIALTKSLDKELAASDIALMCGAVLLFACSDASAKYLNGHMDTIQVVWARYMSAFVLALFMFNPIRRPEVMRTSRPWLQLGRSTLLLVSTALNFVALRYLHLDQAVAIIFCTRFI